MTDAETTCPNVIVGSKSCAFGTNVVLIADNVQLGASLSNIVVEGTVDWESVYKSVTAEPEKLSPILAQMIRAHDWYDANGKFTARDVLANMMARLYDWRKMTPALSAASAVQSQVPPASPPAST